MALAHPLRHNSIVLRKMKLQASLKLRSEEIEQYQFLYVNCHKAAVSKLYTPVGGTGARDRRLG